MSYCSIHRMALGPRGCPQCLRDEAVVRAAEGKRYWRWAAAVVVPFLGLLVLGGWLALRTVPKRDTRLDPALYRGAIESVESALYATERLQYDEKTALKQGLMELPGLLRRQRPSLASRRALELLEPFCLVTAVEVDYDAFDVVATRARWEKLRDESFVHASWFRASTPGLEAAQSSAGARGVPSDAASYQASLDQIRLLAARLETEVQSMPEDYRQADTDVYDRWQSARNETKADVERIRQGFPVRSPDMDWRWRKAYDDLEKALRAAAGIIAPSGNNLRAQLPTPSVGNYRSQGARAALDSAQASLDAAPR